MKNKSIRKISMSVTSMMIACGLLASGASAMAQADELSDADASVEGRSAHRHCSNRTLFGDYGGTAEGVLLNIPGFPPEVQIRVVQIGRAHV